MVGRDDLRFVVQGQLQVTFHHTPAPRGYPPCTCQCPQRNVAKGDDNIGLAHLDLALEEFEAIAHDWQNELVTEHQVLAGDVGFFLRDEGIDVVSGRPRADNVRDKAR